MSITNLTTKYRKTAAKVAAAYASFEAAKQTATKLADQFAHVWKVDCDYAYAEFEAAHKLAVEHQRKVPGTPERVTIGDNYQEASRLQSVVWVWMPLPGAPFIQVRTPSGGTIEFRATRKKDLALVRELVNEYVELMSDERDHIELDLEIRQKTPILAWDAEEGHWDTRKARLARTFSSVMIPAEMQKEIEEDLAQFSQSKDRLARLEMPWRRGYMLSGPPGTGKTSLSLAIAGALNFSIASLSLTDIKDDGMLKKAVGNLRRTVLVIEDIDAYSVSHDRDHNNARDGGLSLSGLLNSLDGFETPDGLVVIVTTNHIENLDPALVRSGRLDRHFHLGYIAAAELERLYTWFYEKTPPTPAPIETEAAELAPAEVTELFKQHLDDADAGWNAVVEAITSKTSASLKAVA